MTAIEQLDALKSALPDLFEDLPLKPEWEEGYIIIPIDDPDYFPELNSQDVGTPDDIDFQSIDNWRETLFPGEDIPRVDEDLVDIFGGNHSGAPLASSGASGCSPPDEGAFYLPFHYYHPKWWGIYLRVEGIEYLAQEIMTRCGSLSYVEARCLARMFLYYHEAYHHKTECFATRLEATHREAFYINGFEDFYQSTQFTPTCLEETLANAHALAKIDYKLRKRKDPRRTNIIDALRDIVRHSPPGYAEAADMTQAQVKRAGQQFSEANENICLPKIKKCPPEIWGTTTHFFSPIANIKSRVNYILPRSSPLAARLPLLRSYMSPRAVIKKLKSLVGLTYVRRGKHPIYRTDDGRVIPIPDHPRDLRPDTLANIIKQAGLDLSIREFQQKK